jgi:hypothetical protein
MNPFFIRLAALAFAGLGFGIAFKASRTPKKKQVEVQEETKETAPLPDKKKINKKVEPPAVVQKVEDETPPAPEETTDETENEKEEDAA